MPEAVRLRHEGSVALLEMMQPERRNAFSDEMKAGLRDAITAMSQNEGVRALVLTGSEGVFCAGGDLKAMLNRHKTGEKSSTADSLQRMLELHDWFKVLRDLPIPVIAAVDGPAFGAGFGLALSADIVLASERAQFNASFGKLGVVPDCNLMWSLPRVVGLQRARELFYTARTVDAEEALRIGICMELHPSEALLPRAMQIAGQMTKVSSEAYALTKAITARAMQSDSDDVLAAEAEAQSKCLTSAYHLEAIARFADKKPPSFSFE